MTFAHLQAAIAAADCLPTLYRLLYATWSSVTISHIVSMVADRLWLVAFRRKVCDECEAIHIKRGRFYFSLGDSQ